MRTLLQLALTYPLISVSILALITVLIIVEISAWTAEEERVKGTW